MMHYKKKCAECGKFELITGIQCVNWTYCNKCKQKLGIRISYCKGPRTYRNTMITTEDNKKMIEWKLEEELEKCN